MELEPNEDAKEDYKGLVVLPLTDDFLRDQAVRVIQEFQDDFDKLEISYRLKQFYTGDQGLHVKDNAGKFQVVLADEERCFLITVKQGVVFYIPLTEVKKIEVYSTCIARHNPIIFLTVTDAILTMIYERRPTILNNRKQALENREPASLCGNLLILHLQPLKNIPSEKPIICDVLFRIQRKHRRYVLEEKSALHVLRHNVQNWLIDSTAEPYDIRFDQCTDHKWWQMMRTLKLVSIFEHGEWRLEPHRHVLRINPITSSFLVNTPEKLIELNPPWHPTAPMEMKKPEEKVEEKNEEKPSKISEVKTGKMPEGVATT